MRIRYLHDAEAHAADNAAGRPHWPAYTPLLLEPIGIEAAEISPAALANGVWESETAVLFLPGPSQVDAPRIQRWVERGGILIGWGLLSDALPGEDAPLRRLFGIDAAGPAIHQPGDFDVGALITLLDHPLTAGVASPLNPDQ